MGPRGRRLPSSPAQADASFMPAQIKCDQYWPNRGTETYGFIQVTLLDTIELATFCVRTFSLHKVGSGAWRGDRRPATAAWRENRAGHAGCRLTAEAPRQAGPLCPAHKRAEWGASPSLEGFRCPLTLRHTRPGWAAGSGWVDLDFTDRCTHRGSLPSEVVSAPARESVPLSQQGRGHLDPTACP